MERGAASVARPLASLTMSILGAAVDERARGQARLRTVRSIALVSLSVAALGVVAGVPLLELGSGGRACEFRVQTGQPCVGCGGTHALEAAVRGDFRAAARANILGAFAGASLWLMIVASSLSLLTGWPHFLRWCVVVLGLTTPIVLVVGVARWWMGLPPGPA